MSSLRNAIPRRAHKERAQPHERRRFGLLEKKKDYRQRAQAYHKKEEYLNRLRLKAANKNEDEFSFSMVKSKTVDGVHKPESVANQYSPEELLIMKTQDMGYVLQKIQSEKKKIEKLKAVLHSLDSQPSHGHIYYAENSEEAEQIQSRSAEYGKLPTFKIVPEHIRRKTAASYRELEARIGRVNALEKVYSDMALKKELQKKGRKRKLREDEIVCEISGPVYKWRAERKR